MLPKNLLIRIRFSFTTHVVAHFRVNNMKYNVIFTATHMFQRRIAVITRHTIALVPRIKPFFLLYPFQKIINIRMHNEMDFKAPSSEKVLLNMLNMPNESQERTIFG